MSAEETMFQEVLAAIQKGQKDRARDLLTRLLRMNQADPRYWLYMSTVVPTKKERIFCLNKVLELDPQNAHARRSLAILGVRKPEPDLAIPFSAQRRKWEARLSEVPAERKISKAGRIQIILLSLAGLVVVALIVLAATGVLGLDFSPRANRNEFRTFPTAVQSPTPTAAIATPTPGPTAPWDALQATYTPTPIYAATPHNLVEAYTIGMRAFSRNDWASSISYFQQVVALEPDAVDVLYLLGESYRMQGQMDAALTAFNQAISQQPRFAPPYVGRARLNLASEEPELEDALEDLQTAAKLDPQYGEAQLELANLHLAQNQPGAALSMLEDAARLLPGSPQVELTRARALMAQENYKDALTAVNRALELDLTLLPAYLVRGEIHALLRQPEKALADLTIYTRYAGGNIDAQTLVLLGEAWYAAGDVDAALNTLDRALVENPRLISALMQRGRIHLDEGNLDEAEADYDAAVKLRRDSFEANAGLAQVWMAQGFYGDAYKRWEEIQKYMETDADQAVLWYYRAICLRELNFPDLAIRDWTRLLEDLPEENVPAELRLAAREMLEAIYTPTPTPIQPTPTATRTPRVSPTPTRTPRP